MRPIYEKQEDLMKEEEVFRAAAHTKAEARVYHLMTKYQKS